jgi:hypothetical protein
VPALALLDLPPRYICVDEHVGAPADEGRPRPEYEDKTPGHPNHFLAEPLDESGCDELVEAPWAEETEDGIVAEVRLERPFELVGRPQRAFCPDDGGEHERVCERGFDFVDEHPGVAIDGDDTARFAPSAARKHRHRFAPTLGDDGPIVGDAHRRTVS